MIQTNQDLEGFLERLGRPFERLDESTYAVPMGSGRPLVALRLAAPVLVVRVDIGLSPKGPAAALLHRRLLELNATKLFYAAYGLEGERVVLGAALELEHVDPSEIQAVLSDVDLALAEHVPELHDILQGKG